MQRFTRPVVAAVAGLLGVASVSAQTQFYFQDFDDNASGTYTTGMWSGDFPNCPWQQGVSRGYMSGTYSDAPRSLKMYYPKGKYGAPNGGGQWPMPFAGNAKYDEVTLEYYIRFEGGFDWQKGGKLPGLTGGGTTATGGVKATGSNGWSARPMWDAGGKIYQYAYHMDQATNYGDRWYWKVNGNDLVLQTNRWYQFRTRIKMNTPGSANGVCQTWVDGTQVLNKTNIRWRNTTNLKVDTLYFSTFFGGNDASWAPDNDCWIYFDRFKLTRP